MKCTSATQFEIYPMTNRTDLYNKWTSLQIILALFAYVNNIQITWKTIHLSVFCRTNSPSINQCRAEENNTECVGKKRFNGRVLPMGFGKSMCYVPLVFLMVICNSLLLLKSLPINIINCIKFYVNCSALKPHWLRYDRFVNELHSPKNVLYMLYI
jgi:hypothetical protein